MSNIPSSPKVCVSPRIVVSVQLFHRAQYLFSRNGLLAAVLQYQTCSRGFWHVNFLLIITRGFYPKKQKAGTLAAPARLSATRMCSPAANLGQPPREPFAIQF